MTAAHRRERLALATLAAVQFTHIMDYMMLMPLGAHLMELLDISAAQFSYLVASYSLAAAATGFAGGFVLDRYDRKRALLTLYTGFGLATLACALAPNYTVLLFARLLAGAFGGLAGAVVMAAAGDIVPPERRGAALGVVMTAFPFAAVMGVPAGLLLADWFEWHAPFFLLAGMSVVIGTFVWRTLPDLPPHPVITPPWQQMREILRHPLHQRGFQLSAALVFAGGCVAPFMAPVMVANVGLTEAQLPLIYLVGGACTFITVPWIGRLADRHDKVRVLGIISAVAAVAAFALTNLPPVPVVVALLVTTLFMVAMSGRFPPAMALITNAVEARYRGGFMSVNSAAQQGFSALANLVAGALVTRDLATGRLEGFPRAGLVAVVSFGLAVVLAARVRRHAPHASAPRPPAAVS